MPIHDLGYRAWRGRLVPQIGRFWVISQAGIRLAWRNMWLRRMLLLSWLPVIHVGALLFVYEQMLANEPGRFVGRNAQYSGGGFSDQHFEVLSLSEADFDDS